MCEGETFLRGEPTKGACVIETYYTPGGKVTRMFKIMSAEVKGLP